MITLAVLLSYEVASPEDVAGDRVNQLWFNVLGLIGVFPLVVGGFILAARPPNRGHFLRQVRYPVLAGLAQFSAAFSVVLAADPTFEGLRNMWGPATPAVKAIAGAFILLYAIPFCLYGFFLSLTHVFRTADIHELVPPLLSTSLAWVMTLVDVLLNTNKGLPTDISLALLLGPPITVTAIAAYEIHRLRTLHGITLRNTLLR
ncbi:hypothetical protein [Spirillospora sp. CA-294931]|uniref:hypothetical protein n=1 Tax=Spirillospora sp. CA-294931 TaxID=3240042 RepID=UPI003D8F185C